MRTTTFAIAMGMLLSCSSDYKDVSEKAYEMSDMAVEENDESVKDYSSMDYSASAEMADNMESENGAEDMKEHRRETKQSQPEVPNFISSQAASIDNSDAIHRLIRNVNMKFKVKDVPQTTYAIESIVLKNGGHIRRSAIDNRNSYSNTVNISKDSAIIIHYDNLVANIQFRVHYSRLDTVLEEIAPYAVHIDYRTVDVKDVTFDLLWEKLKKERMAKKQKRISTAIDNRGQKLNDIMSAEQSLDYAAEQADKALIEDYRMNDRIEYSTINVEIYQSQTQYQERVLRIKSVDEYEPSLGAKTVQALQNGWELIAALFVALLNIWPVLLIIIVGIAVGVRFKNKKGKD